MKPSTEALIASTRKVMEQKYLNFGFMTPSERRLLVMAWLCDAVKVRESGTNRGLYVEAFLDSAGVAPGNPWCASALRFASLVARADGPETGAAAVVTWKNWFKNTKRTIQKPQRGDICMHETTKTTGHIGVVVSVYTVLGVTWINSIEGNTGSGPKGSQRDGDGMYRRTRLKRFWSWGFGR